MLADLTISEAMFSLKRLHTVDIDGIVSVVHLEMEEVDKALYSMDKDLEALGGLIETIKPGIVFNENEVTFMTKALNMCTANLQIELDRDDVFMAKDDGYELSMESIDFTWREIFSFVAKFLSAIWDIAKKQFTKRLTYTGRLAKSSKKAAERFARVNLENPEVLSKKIELPTACRFMVMDYGSKKASMADPLEIKNLLTLLKLTLKPDEYRDAIDLVMKLLLVQTDVSNEDLRSQVKLARYSVVEKLKAYLSLTEKNGDTGLITLTSEESVGGMYFQCRYTTDQFTAPKVTLETFQKKVPKEAMLMEPCSPSDASKLSDVVSKSCDMLIDMRTEYEAIRKFKNGAKEAKTSLNKRIANGHAVDKETQAMFRAIPSYVDLYHKGFGAKYDMIYNYCFSIMAYISASNRTWRIQTH